MTTSSIAHVIGVLAAAGAERFVVDLLCALRTTNARLELIVLSARCDKVGRAMRDLLERHQIPVAVGPTAKLGLRTVLWYRREMQLRSPDIVHLHTPNTELAHFLARPFSGVRPHIVRTIHSTGFSSGWLESVALRRNRAFASIGCSNAVSAIWHKYVSGEIVCIQNGVKYSWPIRNHALTKEYQRRLSLDPTKLHFVSVGRMDGADCKTAPKAHDVLIKAWKLSKLGQQNGRLHLIGDGVLRSELEALAGDDKSIIFQGVRADIADWLLAVHCFVMPSRWEGLPVAGIEAVGTGLPCIFTDIAQLRELNPPVAHWAIANDVSSLSDCLRRFAAKPIFPSDEDVIRVRARFNIDDVAKKYSQIYRRVP